MVVGVRGGCSGSGGGGLGGLPGSCASTSTYGWSWLGLAGLGGAGWPRGREAGSGRSGGVLEACGWRWGGGGLGREVGQWTSGSCTARS